MGRPGRPGSFGRPGNEGSLGMPAKYKVCATTIIFNYIEVVLYAWTAYDKLTMTAYGKLTDCYDKLTDCFMTN